jgi:ribosome-associated protein
MAKGDFEWVRDAEEQVVPSAYRPTRNERKQGSRDARLVLDGLLAFPATALDGLPLDPRTRTELDKLGRISTSNFGARRRAEARMISLLQAEDLPALMAAVVDVEVPEEQADAAILPWRDRLVDEGDPAVVAFVEAYPAVDLQRVRHLVLQLRRKSGGRAERQLRAVLRDALGVSDDQ